MYGYHVHACTCTFLKCVLGHLQLELQEVISVGTLQGQQVLLTTEASKSTLKIVMKNLISLKTV